MILIKNIMGNICKLTWLTIRNSFYSISTQRSSDAKITLLTDTVEVLQRFSKVGTSCGQLARLGFNISDTFYLDYDGLGLGKDLLIYGQNTLNLIFGGIYWGVNFFFEFIRSCFLIWFNTGLFWHLQIWLPVKNWRQNWLR